MKAINFSVFVIAVFVAGGFVYAGLGVRTPEGRVYTLYRSSAMNENARIHVATFDADAEEQYNKENCDTARSLFQSQDGVKVKYWCEKGFFKP